MIFRELRNAVVKDLSQYLKIPVVLSSQVNPEQEYPFMIYSATAPYIPENGLGEFRQIRDPDGRILEERREQPTCTFSFTACSMNREEPWILGEDEALELAESALGWFRHVGYDRLSGIGVTVVDASNVQERSFLQVDEEARRYGFDVTIRYVRRDTRVVGTIACVTTRKKEM